jgi:hypothetical protein
MMHPMTLAMPGENKNLNETLWLTVLLVEPWS